MGLQSVIKSEPRSWERTHLACWFSVKGLGSIGLLHAGSVRSQAVR
jgi:hypothetical protein